MGRARARTRQRRSDTLYFIASPSEGLVKIGVTNSYARRIREIRAQRGVVVDLLALYAGSHLCERRIHAKLEHLRVEGEWFRLTDEVYEFMELMDSGGGVADGYGRPP